MLNLLPDIELQESQETQYVYKLGVTEPVAPTGGQGDEDHVPTGWSGTALDPTNTDNVYRAQRAVQEFAGSFQSATAWGGVTKVADALPVGSLDYVYKLGASAPPAPTGGNSTENHTPAGWARIEPSPTATQNVYRAQRTRAYVAGVFQSAGNWGGVVKVADAAPVTVTDTDYVYRLSRTLPAVPSGGEDAELHQPTGWRRSPMGATSTRAVFYVSRTRTYVNDVFQSATAWAGLELRSNIAHTVVSFTQYVRWRRTPNVATPISGASEPSSEWFRTSAATATQEVCQWERTEPGRAEPWELVCVSYVETVLPALGRWYNDIIGGWFPVAPGQASPSAGESWDYLMTRTVTWEDGVAVSRGGAGSWNSPTDIRTGNHTVKEYAVRRSSNGAISGNGTFRTTVPTGWRKLGEEGYFESDVNPTSTQGVYICSRETTWSGGNFVSATRWGNSTLVKAKTGADTGP